MATLTPGAMTYGEWALRHDPSGKIATMVDLLSQKNGILEDCLAVECQSGNAFEYTQVVKLPTPTRRIYNQGVAATLAGVAKQVATCSEYADWVKLDASLAALNGNLNELRAQEDALHMEALSQAVAKDLFYGDRSSDPTQFTGLANTYNTVNTATSNIAKNVIDCGGIGSTNTSLWLVTWGPKHIHTLYPKGTQAGMQHKDMGLLPALDTQSPQQEFLAYRTYLEWKIGLAIHDWRFCVRAANIDVTQLQSGTGVNLVNTLVRMAHRLPIAPAGVAPPQDMTDAADRIVMGRSAIYCDRTVATYLDLQAMNKTNVLLKMEEWDGEAVTTFRSVPIRIVDALLDSEGKIS